MKSKTTKHFYDCPEFLGCDIIRAREVSDLIPKQVSWRLGLPCILMDFPLMLLGNFPNTAIQIDDIRFLKSENLHRFYLA